MTLNELKRLIEATTQVEADVPPEEQTADLQLRAVSELLPYYHEDEDPPPLPESIMREVKDAYQARWLRIKSTDYNYLASQTEENNELWIKLARELYRIGYLQEHPYMLLMPDIDNWLEEDVVRKTKMTDLPLSSLMIAQDGSTAYCIDSVLDYARLNNGALVLFRGSESTVLSFEEQKNVQQINPRKWSEYQSICSINSGASLDDKSIRVTQLTILKLIELVEKSVFEHGEAANYSQAEQSQAEKAYDAFVEYLSLLTEEEHSNLMMQVIKPYNMPQNFQTVYQNAVGQRSCITHAAKDFCQLIIDYEPNYRFVSGSLNQYVDKYKLSETSQRKVYDVRNPFKHYPDAEAYFLQQTACFTASIMATASPCAKVQLTSLLDQQQLLSEPEETIIAIVTEALSSSSTVDWPALLGRLQAILAAPPVKAKARFGQEDGVIEAEPVQRRQITTINKYLSFEQLLALSFQLVQELPVGEYLLEQKEQLKEQLLSAFLAKASYSQSQQIMLGFILFFQSKQLFLSAIKQKLETKDLTVKDKAIKLDQADIKIRLLIDKQHNADAIEPLYSALAGQLYSLLFSQPSSLTFFAGESSSSAAAKPARPSLDEVLTDCATIAHQQTDVKGYLSQLLQHLIEKHHGVIRQQGLQQALDWLTPHVGDFDVDLIGLLQGENIVQEKQPSLSA